MLICLISKQFLLLLSVLHLEGSTLAFCFVLGGRAHLLSLGFNVFLEVTDLDQLFYFVTKGGAFLRCVSLFFYI